MPPTFDRFFQIATGGNNTPYGYQDVGRGILILLFIGLPSAGGSVADRATAATIAD